MAPFVHATGHPVARLPYRLVERPYAGFPHLIKPSFLFERDVHTPGTLGQPLERLLEPLAQVVNGREHFPEVL